MTDQTILALGSAAQDLKRVATFIQRGSLENAERFLKEANKYAREPKTGYLKPYLRKRLLEIEKLTLVDDHSAVAEEALTIGCILQNAVVAAKR